MKNIKLATKSHANITLWITIIFCLYSAAGWGTDGGDGNTTTGSESLITQFAQESTALAPIESINEGDNVRWVSELIPKIEDNTSGINVHGSSITVYGELGSRSNHQLDLDSIEAPSGWSGGTTFNTYYELSFTNDCLLPYGTSDNDELPVVVGESKCLPEINVANQTASTTGGDGYVPLLAESEFAQDRVFFINHHNIASIKCVNGRTGARCDGYPSPAGGAGVLLEPDARTVQIGHAQGTEVFIGSKLYYAVSHSDFNLNTESDDWGVGCFDISTNSHCAGQSYWQYGPASGLRNPSNQHVSMFGPAQIGNKLYFVDGQAMLHCFDADPELLSTERDCGSWYIAIDDGSVSSRFPRFRRMNGSSPMTIVADGDKLYIGANYGDTVTDSNEVFANREVNIALHDTRVVCIDTNNLSDDASPPKHCWTDSAGRNMAGILESRAHSFRLADLFFRKIVSSDNGEQIVETDAVCALILKPNRRGGCVLASNGASIEDTTNFTRGIPNEIFDAPAHTDGNFEVLNIGTRIYWSSREDGAFCWDWALGGWCSVSKENGRSFIRAPSTAAEVYGFDQDPSTGCIWALGDKNQLWSFDSLGNVPCEVIDEVDLTIDLHPGNYFCGTELKSNNEHIVGIKGVEWEWGKILIKGFSSQYYSDVKLEVKTIDGEQVQLKIGNAIYNGGVITSDTSDVEFEVFDLPNILQTLTVNLTGKVIAVPPDNQRISITTTINSNTPLQFCYQSKVADNGMTCTPQDQSREVSNKFYSSNLPGGSDESYKTLAIKPGLDSKGREPRSSTALGVIVHPNLQHGIATRAYFEPKIISENITTGVSETAQWVGGLQGFKINDKGQIVHKSDDIPIDFKFSEDDGELQFSENGTNSYTSIIDSDGNSNLVPLWDASEVLGNISDTDIIENRVYTDNAVDGRYIFTWYDKNNDGVFDKTIEGVAFQSTNPVLVASDSNIDFPLLISAGSSSNSVNDAVSYQNRAAEIIDFVRGFTNEGSTVTNYDLRNRIVNDKNYRLGDIQRASPLIVGPPSRYFDIIYNDPSYKLFRENNQYRRAVSYVASNDGLIHAFNIGKPSNDEYGPDGHDLGSELWAYVPKNVLPWLGALTNPTSFKNGLLIDGELRAFDVRFRTDVATDPVWRTLLVASMGFGGGKITVGRDGDGNGKADYLDGVNNVTTVNSAHVVFDITDPEVAPILLDEITLENQGYALASPNLVYRKSEQGANGVMEPYLVFGSGPTNPFYGLSRQNSQVFLYKLSQSSQGSLASTVTLPNANSFVSEIFPTDFAAFETGDTFDSDKFAHDAYYFGVTSGALSSQSGSLERINAEKFSEGAKTLLSNDAAAFNNQPIAGYDDEGLVWVFVGTGRYLSEADLTDSSQHYFYGIKEPLAVSNLDSNLDSNGIPIVPPVDRSDELSFSEVEASNLVTITSSSGSSLSNLEELLADINKDEGWKLPLDADGSSNSNQVLTPAKLIGGTLLFIDYEPRQPGDSSCGIGTSYLNAVNYKLGVPPTFNGSLFVDTSSGSSVSLSVGRSVEFGKGLARTPSVYDTSNADPSNLNVTGQTSSSGIVDSEVDIENNSRGISWREVE